MKRTLLVSLAACAALVLPATSAFAHVTVNPREAVQGRYAKLAFRVPNERDNAGTTKLEVNLPAEHPFASVSVRPQPGWTYTVEKVKLATPVKVHDNEISEAATKITWTGGVIKPHEFNEFEVSVGPLPEDVDSITFKALQTYENGEVVRWIEEETPGGAEPEHPAPILKLTKADAATTVTTTAGQTSQAGEVAEPESADAVSKSDVDTARTFGILGMVFGLLGFGSAMAARRRKSPEPPSS
ncbi:MAG TPA: YcnI family protein [Acidimicrobiia bacterium]|nr:YcnI family protein [Acidimicrobiia bacterium]